MIYYLKWVSPTDSKLLFEGIVEKLNEEKIKVINQFNGLWNLDELSLSKDNYEFMKRKKPYGCMIVDIKNEDIDKIESQKDVASLYPEYFI